MKNTLMRTKPIIEKDSGEIPASEIEKDKNNEIEENKTEESEVSLSAEEIWKIIEEKEDEDDEISENLAEQLKQQFSMKIQVLKEKTEDEIAKTIQSKDKGHHNLVKSLVSKKKARFCYDGFDLDLTYITSRIIAMGFPSSSIEGIYRNNLDDVKNFFIQRHPYHYKVYNLCAEKTYPEGTFYNQAYYPFKDHEAPPLNMLRPLCEDCKSFLDKDPENIVAIHCKAGKGRTGTVISCLLLYMGYFNTIDECLEYYGLMRTFNYKGVTIPSQERYVRYFEKIFKENIPHPIVFVTKTIKKIRMVSIKSFSSHYNPSFTIENNDKTYKYNDYKKSRDLNEVENYINFDLGILGYNVTGDVRLVFYRNPLIGKKEKTFLVWFNTNFIPDDEKPFVFTKSEIDKACKDLKQKIFKDDFKLELYFFTNKEIEEANKKNKERNNFNFNL